MADRVRTRQWSGVDFYDDLGVAPDAPQASVDEAFRRQAKALHPDRNPEATAEARFKRLTAAYDVLRDPVTRRAYDDFRFRVDAGLLYSSRPGGPVRPAPAPMATRPAPVRRERRALPNGLRVGIGWGLAVLGVAAALWALVGPLPSHSVGDTSLAVQITIGIIALKFAVGAVIVIKYPQLKARWHKPPGQPTPAPDRVAVATGAGSADAGPARGIARPR